MVLLAVLAALAGLVVLRLWGLAGLIVVGGIALVGGLIVWAVVMPSRLAPAVPSETLNQIPGTKERLEAIDARTRLHHDLRNGALQLLTVLAVLAGAVVGFQQLAEDRDQARQQLAEDRDKALKDRELTRQGQASARFTEAVRQLGSTAVETRIGGIYGLDQIAEQAPDNTGPVGEVLLAWLNGRPRQDPPPKIPLREHAPDVQAALTVLTGQPGQRYSSIIANRLNLRGLALRGADLNNANLVFANLRSADLRSADLDEANLRSADLRSADLNNAGLYSANLVFAKLNSADLRSADLAEADLAFAHLNSADLRGAYLIAGADLAYADLRGADLRGAYLNGAVLGHADLRGADLRGAHLNNANPFRTDLTGAKVDRRTRRPTTGFDWRRAGAEVAP